MSFAVFTKDSRRAYHLPLALIVKSFTGLGVAGSSLKLQGFLGRSMFYGVMSSYLSYSLNSFKGGYMDIV